MPVRRPSRAELSSIAAEANLSIAESDLDGYREVVDALLDRVERVQGLAAPTFPPTEPGRVRPSGYRPTEAENPYNAWITRCTVDGDASGPLDGLTVGLKDSISLAGVELTCGSHLLEGYVPSVDATVVTRVLDAGGTITGKLNMESFAASGTGDLSDFGPVLNPHSTAHLAGGSSSGSAAAPAAGEVDVALGTDQGGSCRIPASCCGVVGLKPTTGLVPYTGVFPADHTLDHVGPIARSVEHVARTLDVIAGRDGLDPRQPADLTVGEYTEALGGPVSDLEVGVLEEGFGLPAGDDAVDDAVRSAVETFESLGATTGSVSAPLHREGVAIWTVIRYYGALQVHRQGGVGSLHEGWYDTGLARAFDAFRRARGREFPATIKATWLAMAHVDRAYGTALYGKAHNLTRRLEDAYDDALAGVDLLAMPTIPMTPFEHRGEMDEIARAGRSAPVPANTCPFDLTGHPAISVPCGAVDGLPVGLMLVGRRFEEEPLLRAAAAFERAVDWSPP